MKKSILIIATVALSILNANATNENPSTNPPANVETLTKENIAQVFEWKVETNKCVYSGTSLSLESAQNMIALACSGEMILGKEITSYLVLKSDLKTNTNRNYFWEVETATGFAKGYSSSEDYAHKMIQLVASGDAIISKIIISQPQH